MSKFGPLLSQLEGLERKGHRYWATSYDEVEKIIGDRLPVSARKYSAYWKWGSNPEKRRRSAMLAASWLENHGAKSNV